MTLSVAHAVFFASPYSGLLRVTSDNPRRTNPYDYLLAVVAHFTVYIPVRLSSCVPAVTLSGPLTRHGATPYNIARGGSLFDRTNSLRLPCPSFSLWYSVWGFCLSAFLSICATAILSCRSAVRVGTVVAVPSPN